MRILCCPAQNFRPETQESLARFAPTAEIVNVAEDPFDYWRAIYSRWNGDDSLLLIEQDIQFTAKQVADIETCPEHWCVFGYHHYADKPSLDPFDKTAEHINGGQIFLLGFTRFSAEMMARIPRDIISCNHDGSIPWWNIDSRIGHTAWRYRYRPHYHGIIDHHHYENEAL